MQACVTVNLREMATKIFIPSFERDSKTIYIEVYYRILTLA